MIDRQFIELAKSKKALSFWEEKLCSNRNGLYTRKSLFRRGDLRNAMR